MRNLDWLYNNQDTKSPLDFYFDNLVAPPLNSLIPKQKIEEIYNIIRDPRLSCNYKLKQKKVADILEMYGFYKYHAGTNREIYQNYNYPDILIKVAMDKDCLTDNIWEFKNQFKFKPFIPKVFEVDTLGVIALFEKVIPIKSREEFLLLAEDIFDMLITKFVGKYVLDDIGTKAFMNYGYRENFGPVLLDFPYAYELDDKKLICSKLHNGKICNGVIDYDDGFNSLVCEKCGATYTASELKTEIKNKTITIQMPKGENSMVIRFKRGDKEIGVVDTTGVSTSYKQYNRKATTTKHSNKWYTDGESFDIICNRQPSTDLYNNNNKEEIKESKLVETETSTEVESVPVTNVDIIDDYKDDVVWSKEKTKLYDEARTSLTAAIYHNLPLSVAGYDRLKFIFDQYPDIKDALFIEFEIVEIPNPVIESESSEQEDEIIVNDKEPDIELKEQKEKTPEEILNEYKKSVKPKIVISPRDYKSSNIEATTDSEISVENLY